MYHLIYSPSLFLLLLAWFGLLYREARGYVNVSLVAVGYNYAADLVADSWSFRTVVDTSTSQLILHNLSFIPNESLNYSFCSILSVDGTGAYYVDFGSSKYCSTSVTVASLGTAQATVQVYDSNYLQVVNDVLHDWVNTTAGDLGLSYNTSSSSGSGSMTAFQRILANATSEADKNQTFGLDLRDTNSSLASLRSASSSLQLGGILESYSEALLWQSQPVTNPSVHQFYVENFQFCSVSIFGNYSSNWMVLVDSSSSCLSLPGEIYDSFAVWFNNKTVVESWADLPAFSFTLFGFEETMYLPLASLIVQPDAIKNETGAPFVQSNQQGLGRLCVIRGSDIIDSFDDYTSPTPSIIFGSMALRPFYFAADFSTLSVALTSKLSASERSYYAETVNSQSTASCVAPLVCQGKQTYEPASNACHAPRCKQYFFESLNSDRTDCEYKASLASFGIFFIVLIVVMEVVSYCVMQYTAHNLLQNRQLTGAVRVDGVTITIGRYLACLVDAFVQKVLKWHHTNATVVVEEEQHNALLQPNV